MGVNTINSQKVYFVSAKRDPTADSFCKIVETDEFFNIEDLSIDLKLFT